MTRENTNKSAACARLETELVLFHYGELSGAERRQVEAHAKDCTACTEFLMELASLLPKTVLADDPPPEFWNEYSRELRHKLADIGERGSWWQRLSVFRPWAMPALATAAVVVLALTFTLGKGLWKSRDARPPIDAALLEALPVAENLDFYNNLEILDAMELLEAMGEPGNGAA